MAVLEKVFLIISVLATLAAGGVFVYTDFIYKKPIPDNEKELQALKDEVSKGAAFKTFKLKKFTTNLYSRKTRLRYLNLEAYIEPFAEEQINQLEEKESIIYDTVILTAGRLKPEDLNSLSGKILFENKVKNNINDLYEEPVVRKVYFSVFVVQ